MEKDSGEGKKENLHDKEHTNIIFCSFSSSKTVIKRICFCLFLNQITAISTQKA